MWRAKIKNQRGQALVEMALVLPILILIVFGIIEFGRIYTAQLQINSVARQTVRSAAVGDPANDGDVAESAANSLGSGTVTVTTASTGVTATLIDANAAAPTTVTITRTGTDVIATVNYSLHLYVPFVVGSDSDQRDLSAVVTMKDEGL